MNQRLVFFGNERIATAVTTTAPTLRTLIAAGYDVAVVVTNTRPATSRKVRPLEIETVAAELGIPVLSPARPRDILDQLRDLQADAAVLVAYGRIIPQTVIDLFPHGIINIHPSRLPQHRGSIPIEAVMLNGSPKTAVSIMQLSAKMDAGPVFGARELTLTGRESKQDLADTLLRLGGQELISLLPGILDGSVTPTPQDETQATYDQLLTKSDGIIDWTKPAERLEREIRAYLGWPGSRTTLDGVDAIITQAHLLAEATPTAEPGTAFRTPQGQLAVHATGGALIIDQLKPASKREMTGQAFLAGHRTIV